MLVSLKLLYKRTVFIFKLIVDICLYYYNMELIRRLSNKAENLNEGKHAYTDASLE